MSTFTIVRSVDTATQARKETLTGLPGSRHSPTSAHGRKRAWVVPLLMFLEESEIMEPLFGGKRPAKSS